MVPELLVLAVDFHRAPLAFGHLTDPRRPLPEGFGDWLLESGTALAAGNIEATAATLGVSPQALREAFLFFVRQTLLLPGADHYRVLGLSRDCPAESAKRHYSLLVRLFHPDKVPGEDERRIVLTARVNAAYQTLRDAEARSRYDRQLPPPQVGGRAAAERLDFFRPRDPIKPFARAQRPTSRTGLRARPLALWVLALLGTGGLLLLSLSEPEPPALRIGPQAAGGAAPPPAYLRQGGEHVRPARAVPAVGPEPAGGADPAPGVDEPAPAPSAAPLRLTRTDRATGPEKVPAYGAALRILPAPGAAGAGAAEGPSDLDSQAPGLKGLAPALAAAEPGLPTPDTARRAGDDEATARATSEAAAAATAPKDAGKRAGAPAGTSAAPPTAPARKSAEAPSPAPTKAEAPSTSAPQAASPSAPRSLPPAADTRPAVLAGHAPASAARPERRTPPAAREAPRKPEPKKAPPSGAPKVAAPPPPKAEPAPPPSRATASPGKKAAETFEPDRLAKASPPANPGRRAEGGVPGARAAARVITRLQRSYTNGDVGGLTSLFTANAVVDNGAGHAYIRQRYSAIFERDRHRRISIFGLRWRPGPHQRLLGTGEIRLRGRESRASQWRSKSGTIQFELVPWRGDYQISKMTQRLSSR